jgi:RING finger protein 113A
MASTEPVNVPFFKKKRSRPTTARQRSASPPAASSNLSGPIASSSKTTVVLPTRKTGGNLLSAGTKRTASQRHADSLDDGDADGDERREGPGVNWGAAGSHIDAAREIIAGDEIEAVLAKRRREEAGEPDEPAPDDGFYRGQKAYATHIRKNQEVPKAMRTGPQRSTGNTIRTVTIVDYQPDVCKDYKGALLHMLC